jgi:hypothetical protein
MFGNGGAGTLKSYASFSGSGFAGLLLGLNSASVGAATAMLDINGDKFRLRTAKTPASATAVGNTGDFCWDANYLYIWTATNTVRRVAHSTF